MIEPILALGRQRGWDHFELRGEPGGLSGAVPSAEYVSHSVLLDGNEESQFRNIKDSQRRNIQTARRSGVEVCRLETREAVDAYYALHCLTRRRQGLPPQPHIFFNAIHKHLISSGLGFVLLARFEGRWIAGGVFFRFGTQAIYKFGASDPKFQHVRANSLLMWEAIRHFGQTGAKRLSLGRTDPNNLGLLRFKRSWGAQETTIRYYRFGLRKEVRPGISIAEKCLHCSPMLFRHMPIWFLRVLGRLLYRYIG
jgi:lipid II:glycine glycyltransferase (peptidoglycan interpeptide bridge formation enzyme)